MNLQMSRDDVERLLDLQVRAGRMTPEMKEEKMREYDMKVQQAGMSGQQMYGQQAGMSGQQMYGQQAGMPGQQMYGQQAGMSGQQMYDQSYGMNSNQTVMNGQPQNDRYPRIKPHAQGYLNGPEMIGILVLAVVLLILCYHGYWHGYWLCIAN